MQRHEKTRHFKDWVESKSTAQLEELKTIIHKKKYDYLHKGQGSGSFQLTRGEPIFQSYDNVYGLVLKELRSRA